MVLLVIDTQREITNNDLYQFDRFVSNTQKLIHEARVNNIEVIYVRHDDGVGSELTKGTDGFEIYEKFEPVAEEKIFDKKFNSAFNGTGLVEYIKDKGEKNIIVVGLQTDYCMDASIKCGFEHGFKMIVPEYTNTTIDNEFMTGEQSYKYYNEHMWNHRYAECILLEEALRRIQQVN